MKLDKLVTLAFKRKRDRYEKNDQLFVQCDEEKVSHILNNPDWAFMDYDDTLADAPALQTVLSLAANLKTWPWYVGTAFEFVDKGLERLDESVQRDGSIRFNPARIIEEFKLEA